jgi:hypothetical protein
MSSVSIRAEVMPLFLRQLVPKKTSFLTNSDVCCQKSSGHKAVNFGRNPLGLQSHKNLSIPSGSGCDLYLFDMTLVCVASYSGFAIHDCCAISAKILIMYSKLGCLGDCL